jgi:hypothetical protein
MAAHFYKAGSKGDNNLLFLWNIGKPIPSNIVDEFASYESDAECLLDGDELDLAIKLGGYKTLNKIAKFTHKDAIKILVLFYDSSISIANELAKEVPLEVAVAIMDGTI